MESKLQQRTDQLKVILHLVLAAVLCILAVSGILLRGREAVAALTWGWEDIVTPITSELKHGHQVKYGVYDFDQRRPFSQAKGVAIEHIFVSWLSYNSSAISSSFQYVNERNRWL